MEIVYKKVEELEPYKRNPRDNDDAVKYVANSIKEFGFKVPIIIDKNNVIVAGHTRLKAAKKLDYKEVPCIIADDLNDEQIKAFRLADNKVSEKADWLDTMLDLEMMDIDLDMSLFGFDKLENTKEKTINDHKIESMEIKAFEHHDYVVFVFDNQMDWINIVNEFGIKKVDAGYGETKKVGVGRVINGKRLLEKLRHQDSDTE